MSMKRWLALVLCLSAFLAAPVLYPRRSHGLPGGQPAHRPRQQRLCAAVRLPLGSGAPGDARRGEESGSAGGIYCGAVRDGTCESQEPQRPA